MPGGAGEGRARPALQNPARSAAGPSRWQSRPRSRPSRRQSHPARPSQVSPRRQRGRSGAGPGAVGSRSRCGAAAEARAEREQSGAGRMQSGLVSAAAAPLPHPAPLPPALPACYSSVLGSTVGRWGRGRGSPRGASCAPQQLWVWRQRSGKRNRPKLIQTSPDSDFFWSLRYIKAQLG